MKWFIEGKWGAKSLVSLYLSVLSGLVLGIQYDPTHPLYSTGTLELIIPFGSFWRSLHFYASQFFFLYLLIHIGAIITARYSPKFVKVNRQQDESGQEIPPDSGLLKLAVSVPVAILILFSGYILRGDATGKSAGIIAENITLSIPVIGLWLNSLLFDIADSGMKVVFVNHLVALGVVWGYLVWGHLRKYRVTLLNNPLLVVTILALSVFLVAPIELFSPGEFHISGPWFFIGLQELLRVLQPIWAGVVFPAAGFALFYKVLQGHSYKAPYFKGFILWCLVYVGLTITGLIR